jgi:hypothetical protein
MRFSLFSSIPNTSIIARDYDQQELKTKYIPNLKRELEPGWLKPYLFRRVLKNILAISLLLVL